MINNSWKNQEKRNYNSELLESTFCSKPKKESRYLKVSSGESSMRDLLIWSAETTEETIKEIFLTLRATSVKEWIEWKEKEWKM